MSFERSSSIALCVWPGLSSLWLNGRWSGLLSAIGFTALLNAALLGSFVWPRLFESNYLLALWAATGIFWVWSAISSWLDLPKEIIGNRSVSPEQTQLLQQAQVEFLGGHFDEARLLLQRLIRQNPGDVDGRIFLASVYRHNSQCDLARMEIEKLQKYDLSYKWQDEIVRELELIQRDELEELEETNETESQDTFDDSSADDFQKRPANDNEDPVLLPISQTVIREKRVA